MEKLRVAVIGNTNNSPLRLAEGFRILGHDAHLFVTRKELLHRPESIYPPMASGYPSWIHDISDVTDDALASGVSELFDRFAELGTQFDFSVLNDWAPSVARYLNHPYFALLTGSDLSYYANFDVLPVRSASWDPGYKRSAEGRRNLEDWARLIARQRDGIAAARTIMHPVRGLVAENDKMLDALGVTDEVRIEVWPCAINQLEYVPAPKNKPIRILAPARINIALDADAAQTSQDLKGTDILLLGIAKHCLDGGDVELHLIEKGRDVDRARTMIEKAGVRKVIWHPEMPTFRLRKLMAESDLVCDQFNGTPLGMVASDAYAMGRAVMANVEANNIDGRFPEKLPGFHAATADDVAGTLAELQGNPDRLEKTGLEARRFAEKYLRPESMAENLLKLL